MIGRRSFLALPLAGLAPAPASAERSTLFVISDSFYVLGVATSLEEAKQAAVRLELERYVKWYDRAAPIYGTNKWWRDNHPSLLDTEVRSSEDKPERWRVWNHRKVRNEWHLGQIKIDAVPVV